MNEGVYPIRPPNQPGKYSFRTILIPLIFIGIVLFLLGYFFLTTSTSTLKQQIKQALLMRARSTAAIVKEDIKTNPLSLESYFSKQLYTGEEGSIYSVKLNTPLTPSSKATLTVSVPLEELGLKVIAQQPLRTAYRPVRLHTIQTIVWLGVFYVLIIFAFRLVLGYTRQIAESYHYAVASDQTNELHKKITDLNRELARLTQLRSEFVSVLSRNLRTPLQHIKESVSSLKDNLSPLEPKQEENITLLKKDTERLLQLIGNLSDLAKMETGRIELRRRSVDPSALIRSATGLMESQAASKKISLVTELPDNLPNIHIDLDRILQILVNLVENGINFNREDGQVRLSVVPVNDNFIQIKITDTGPGLTKEDMTRLLPEKGITLSDIPARTGGTRSIKLAISKMIIELHQGRFWGESELGKGTTFYLTLPIANQ